MFNWYSVDTIGHSRQWQTLDMMIFYKMLDCSKWLWVLTNKAVAVACQFLSVNGAVSTQDTDSKKQELVATYVLCPVYLLLSATVEVSAWSLEMPVINSFGNRIMWTVTWDSHDRFTYLQINLQTQCMTYAHPWGIPIHCLCQKHIDTVWYMVCCMVWQLPLNNIVSSENFLKFLKHNN